MTHYQQHTMNIEDITMGQARELMRSLNQPATSTDNPYRIGANYFLRTVTHHHTGRLVEVTTQELVLEDACWIADDGRLTQALNTCEFGEVEVFPKGRVIIGRAAIIDATEINNLPSSQK